MRDLQWQVQELHGCVNTVVDLMQGVLSVLERSGITTSKHLEGSRSQLQDVRARLKAATECHSSVGETQPSPTSAATSSATSKPPPPPTKPLVLAAISHRMTSGTGEASSTSASASAQSTTSTASVSSRSVPPARPPKNATISALAFSQRTKLSASVQTTTASHTASAASDTHGVRLKPVMARSQSVIVTSPSSLPQSRSDSTNVSSSVHSNPSRLVRSRSTGWRDDDDDDDDEPDRPPPPAPREDDVPRDAPPPLPADDAADTVTVSNAQTAAAVAGPTTGSDSLPVGWTVEVTDDGDIFYYNATQGVSSWEKPIT